MITKGSSIKYVRKIFRKTNISNPLIHTRTCVYQGVRNISFSENFTYVLNRWSLSLQLFFPIACWARCHSICPLQFLLRIVSFHGNLILYFQQLIPLTVEFPKILKMSPWYLCFHPRREIISTVFNHWMMIPPLP